METKAIIFDLDGTLYESPGFARHLIFGDLFHLRYLALERQCRKQLHGKFFPSSAAYYDALFNLIAEKKNTSVEKVSNWFWKRYMPLMTKVIKKRYTARPGVRGFVDKCHAAGIKVAVLSDYAYAKEKVAATGMDALWFDAILESPEFGGLKPCMATFHNVCKFLDINPSEAIMIGDRLKTDGGASAAGLKFIHVIPDGAKRATPDDKTWGEILDSEF